MGDVDPEDPNSLDGNDEVLLVQAEMLEEAEKAARGTEEEEEDDDEELQTSALSVLGGERELTEFSEEEQDRETEELPATTEEPRVQTRPAEFRQVVPPMALPLLPVVKLDPPSTTSTPVPSTTSSEAEELYSAQGLQPPSNLAQVAADPPSERRLEFSQVALSDAEEHSVESSGAATEKPPKTPKTPKSPEPLSCTELLCGGAAVVAVVGVVAYAAVAYCRK
ncbi:proline-, glutamic acid- and leucine-rich protein 1 [Pseudoliparis swirei]|uniref:proline-, glutamic acid- and leucine-rich protein 1 n=1 Tax=Pseudoliparis swirei TaxID=2059687 RepID=UPI0024BE76CE|nr:proline-, glutamic acid- and leucine-rich protein 1 [Pseudoliparis swirei]XP_056281067.1 proline-, glutamic acid- and leucine-rich protein 1 [Pseudoliparis swirei]XP_056281068.1 proline-, glutamic acid- and leucine-rich protein 1 [Pseudoliparis swirei]